jgi:hypothetical protein
VLKRCYIMNVICKLDCVLKHLEDQVTFFEGMDVVNGHRPHLVYGNIAVYNC